MATWPIVRTQRSMPGEAGGTRGNLDYPDEAIRGWREFQKLVADAENEWSKRRLKQIDSQISEYKIRYAEEVEKFSASLDKNQDESTYPAELEKFNNNVRSFLPKDRIASAAADLYARGKIPFHQKTIRMLQDAKLEDKWFAGLGALEVRVRDGDASLPEYKVENMKGVALGHITRTVAEENVRKLTDNVEYDRMMAYSKSKEGSRKVLETYSTEGGTIKIGAFPDLKDPGKVMVMKNLAMGAIGEEERIKELLITGSNQSMSKDAIDFSISPIQKWKEIQQLDTGDDEKIVLFDKFVKARQKIVSGLGNPFNTTTDEIVRKDMMERARSKTLPYKEINDAEGISISTPDAVEMRKTLEDKDDKSKSFQESEAAKNLIDQIDALLPKGAKAEREEVALNQIASDRGLGILRSSIENNPDWTLQQKNEEALRIGRRLERELEDGVLEEVRDGILKKTEITQDKGFYRKKGLAVSPFMKKGITKAKFDKLPSGAIFIAPDGKRRRKP